MFACQEGHTEAAKVLAESGAQLNLQKEEWGSPLMLACKEGHSGVVKLSHLSTQIIIDSIE